MIKREQKLYLLAVGILIAETLFLGYIFTSNKARQAKQPQDSVAQVQLKEAYQNPFDANTQYVNPFSEYKNPFDQLP